MQRVPDSSAADGDRAVKKRNLSARTPPQAATGALAVAEDPHSDVADAFVDAQQLDHNVRRSTRPRTQRQKRELFHSVRVLGGNEARIRQRSKEQGSMGLHWHLPVRQEAILG